MQYLMQFLQLNTENDFPSSGLAGTDKTAAMLLCTFQFKKCSDIDIFPDQITSLFLMVPACIHLIG